MGLAVKQEKEAILFSKRLFDNLFLWGAFVIGFFLLNIVLLTPALKEFFAVTPINTTMLFTIYLLSFASMLTIQVLKWIFSNKNSKALAD